MGVVIIFCRHNCIKLCRYRAHTFIIFVCVLCLMLPCDMNFFLSLLQNEFITGYVIDTIHVLLEQVQLKIMFINHTNYYFWVNWDKNNIFAFYKYILIKTTISVNVLVNKEVILVIYIFSKCAIFRLIKEGEKKQQPKNKDLLMWRIINTWFMIIFCHHW